MHPHAPQLPAAPRRDWRVLAGFVSFAIIAVCSVAIVLVLRDTLDPLRRAQAAQEAYENAQRAQRLQWADDVAGACWRLLPLALITSLGGVVVVMVYRRWATAETIRAYHLTQLARAQQPQLPQQLHYAPHLTSRAETRPALLDAPSAPHDAPDMGVPTFATLLERGHIGVGKPLLLGYEIDTGDALSGSWLDLYSTAVSGMPGSGKTTSQRFLACQTALHGARFAICDPHAGAADDSLGATLAPLSAAFVCAPASSDKAILEVVRYVADVGKRRISGQDSDTTPLILWVDELTHLLGRSTVADELGGLLEAIAQEYRKRMVFVCASGQIWTAARTTSELRDSFASVLCHRMKRSQARLLLPTEEAEQVERLTTGTAVLWRTSGVTTTVQVPLTTAADVGRVAGLLATPQATHRHTAMPESSQKVAYDMPDGMPKGSQVFANGNQAYTASGRGTAASAEAARAAGLFLGGMDPSALVLELRGVKSSQGKTYQTALGEVMNLVREGMAGQ